MQKKNIISTIKNLILIFGITFVLLEIVLAIYIRATEIKIELPTYSFENTQGFWFDINPFYGTSHLPNHTYRQKKYCFDVLYQSNSHGFRDQERIINAENKRVVALGDSFTEGVGVAINDRLTNLLEEDTNIPHLNYGMAGNFGSTQLYMLYKNEASKYTHEAVLIGILPSNDFIDDDYEINLKVGGDRYQPFLNGTYPNYDVVYYADSLHKSKAVPRKQRWIAKILKNFTNTYNMLSYLKALRKIKVIPKDKLLDVSKVPSYFNYTDKQFNRMRYAIEQIKILAGNRPVMVYSIPIFKEIEAYREHGKNPLGKALKAICYNIGVEYLDLLPKTDKLSIEACESLFLTCDGHWSEKGNRFAKEEIQSKFEYYR
ncbi:hypothetical protein ACFFU1_03965 [Algibacter miyuki]|uniref:SGNH hydrolase-type esterase domain-containing protein n=1 Tax=Algibacter miyuki TaxID=1306933 RepID=A0ABV5GYB9_9FLAO|nr:hypothetical protein [Algibacter miyuki]MDN3664283.1 hypothetical protein [Algibacter miyuki]